MTGEILNSMSHGTSRRMSRSDCKPFADSYDYANLRRSLLVPSGVEDSSLRTDGLSAFAQATCFACSQKLSENYLPQVLSLPPQLLVGGFKYQMH